MFVPIDDLSFSSIIFTPFRLCKNGKSIGWLIIQTLVSNDQGGIKKLEVTIYGAPWNDVMSYAVEMMMDQAHRRGWQADLANHPVTFTLTGSENTFYVIYSHYYHYLNLIGARRNFNEDKIKDAINDVFFYLWENKSDLTKVSNHHNYIITSFLRKLYRKELFTIEGISESGSLPDFLLSPSVEELHIRQDMDETVSQMIKEHLDNWEISNVKLSIRNSIWDCPINLP